MAEIEEGQIGAVRGKIGRVVVASFRKKTVVRGAPKKSTKPPTEGQLKHRAQFALAASFVNGLAEFVDLGFKTVKGNALPTHMAIKEYLANAVTGEYPNYVIDYAAVKISDGKGRRQIDNQMPFTKSPVTNNKVTLTWEALEGGRPLTLPTDDLYVVFYNATLDYFMNYAAAVKRSQLTVTLRTPHEDDTDNVQGWAFYVSADKLRSSRSVYLGRIS